tara:strand:- start:12541 stop:12894 length:354 start_codon:yes stop_codon:yes gene_type:complete
MKYLLVVYIIFTNILNASEIETRITVISKNLRCLVCDGQSVYESNSDFARDIKNYIKKEIINNKTDNEIYDFLISKYGESIIFNPLPNIKNIMLWLAPAIFFVIGTLIFIRRLNVPK